MKELEVDCDGEPEPVFETLTDGVIVPVKLDVCEVV